MPHSSKPSAITQGSTREKMCVCSEWGRAQKQSVTPQSVEDGNPSAFRNLWAIRNPRSARAVEIG
eukprot:13598006-Alexandrium_andersonii.AAC.2